MRIAALQSNGWIEASPALEAQEAELSAEAAAERVMASAPQSAGDSESGLGGQSKDQSKDQSGSSEERKRDSDGFVPASIEALKIAETPAQTPAKGAGAMGAKIFALAHEREIRARAIRAYCSSSDALADGALLDLIA